MNKGFLSVAGIMADRQSENEDDIAIGADAIAPDESDTLASAVSEIVADEAAINDGTGQIETAAAAADGLETVAEAVEAIPEAERTPEVIGAIEASVESMLKIANIGVQYKQLGLPSSESFSKVEHRAQLGEATIESLKETASKIWESIIAAIKKSIAWVQEFFSKIFGAAERLQKRAAALKEKAPSLTGTAKEKELKNEGVGAAVSINGKAATAEDVKKVTSQAQTVFDGQKKLVDTLASTDLEKGIAQISFRDYGLKSAGALGAKITADKDTAVFISEPFPGEAVAYMTEPKSDQGSENATRYRAGTAVVGEKKVAPLPTLSTSEIANVATSVEELAKVVVGYKRNLADINAKKNAFITKLEGFIKTENKDKKEGKQMAKANAQVFRRLMDEPAASTASLAVRSASAVLQYAELSARQYNNK